MVEDGGIRLSGPNSDLHIVIIGPVQTHLDLQNQTTYWSDVFCMGAKTPSRLPKAITSPCLPVLQVVSFEILNIKKKAVCFDSSHGLEATLPSEKDPHHALKDVGLLHFKVLPHGKLSAGESSGTVKAS